MASPSFRADRAAPLVFFLAILAVVTFCLFAPSLRSDFSYDSRGQILVGDYIHQPAHLPDVLTFRVMSQDVLDFNRPVQLASLMADSLIWGKNPFGYHLTNILLHLVATGLTLILICHLLQFGTPGRPPSGSWRNFSAFLATLLCAVHPLVTEAVCEPSNRKDILAAVFGLGALLILIGHLPARNKGNLPRLLLCFLFTLLAIGAKEVGVAVPVVIFLYWLLFRRREPLKFWAFAIAGSTTVALAFLIARFALAHRQSEIFLAAPAYPGGSFGQTLLIQPSILVLYLTNLLWPAHLCADYTIYSVRFFPLTFSLIVLAIVVAALAWWSARDRRACFGLGVIAAALLPVCNLVPIYNPAADRYLYLPLIGVAILIATGLNHPWLTQKPLRREITVLGLLLLAAILAQLTLQREWVWSSPVRLWQDTLDRNPRSFQARTGYPEALLDAGRLEEAKDQYEATLATPYRETPSVWAGYAIVLHRLHDEPDSANAVRHALLLKPDLTDTARMVRTMQYEPAFAAEFARLAAGTPPAPSANP